LASASCCAWTTRRSSWRRWRWPSTRAGSGPAIGAARRRRHGRLILESNTILEPAIALYRKLGFTEFSGVPSEYDRCNIHMELWL
jgi:hypothetical protein